MSQPNHPFAPRDRVVVIAETLSNGAPNPYHGLHGVVREVRPTGAWPVRVQLDEVPSSAQHAIRFATVELEHEGVGLTGTLPELPQRIRGATLTPSYLDEGLQSAQTLEPSRVDEYTCSQCGWVTFATGPVDVDEPDPFQSGIDVHLDGHRTPEEGAARDIGMWHIGTADVILYRTADSVTHCDLMTDARVEEPAELRELAQVLVAAADAWEASS